MPSEQILGINFFNGEVDDAVNLMAQHGGFLVAPSGTCFARLDCDEAYRHAVSHADIALADSGAMVLLWRLLRGRSLNRISGWKYLGALSTRFFKNDSESVFWVLPNEMAKLKLMEWLRMNRFLVRQEDIYIAPMYGSKVEDPILLERIRIRRPKHIVVGIGSGPQEKLGFWLREQLSYRPAIHCVGAALGFWTGEQVKIPGWADRLYLGWLIRLFAQPRIFIPRLSRALKLPLLMLRCGKALPPLRGK